MDTGRRRRPRGSLVPEAIVRAAFELADEVGLAAFTMPQLADRLGAGLTSVYWHFRTKEALLLAMSGPAVDRLTALMLRPDDEPPEQWPRFLRAYFIRQREVYLAHPLLTDLTIMRNANHSREASQAGFAAVDIVLSYLVTAGFDARTAWFSYATLELFTQGTVVSERSRQSRGEPLPGRQHAAALRPSVLPVVSAAIEAEDGVFLDFTGGGGFEFGLDAILHGLEHNDRSI